MGEYPYHCFHKDSGKAQYEGRFWNCGGKQIAIIASVTKNVNWAAYIGTDAPVLEEQADCPK